MGDSQRVTDRAAADEESVAYFDVIAWSLVAIVSVPAIRFVLRVDVFQQLFKQPGAESRAERVFE